MKKGKKKGEFKKARERHLFRQAQSDALKKLKKGETIKIHAWHETGLKKFLVRPFEEGEPIYPQQILCLFGRKFRVMYYVDDEGPHVENSYHRGYPNSKYYFGVAISEV